MISFNRPYLTGKETYYIEDAVNTGKISGNGKYTKVCQDYFQKKWGLKKCLLTTSCTDALEMCALLIDVQQGDEIIVPSYTFVSSALAFVREGAKIIFCDSRKDHPGIDEDKIEELITSKTKAIVVVHYAGVACDMKKIMSIAENHNLFVIEDAAHAIDSYYISNDNSDGSQKKIPLGSIGHLSCFSFHETKNIQCGEGGLLAINDERFINRAEIIWEKGTNRAQFFRKEISKYGWIDIGSSFLPSEITAAFLWAQIENIEKIQNKRKKIWNKYYSNLKNFAQEKNIRLPIIPEYSTNNAHIFYLIFENYNHRNKMIAKLKQNSIHAVFHYLSLHNSQYYKDKHDGRSLPESDNYSECLLRLPLYYDLTEQNIDKIINIIKSS